jgi:hypothetical protein
MEMKQILEKFGRHTTALERECVSIASRFYSSYPRVLIFFYIYIRINYNKEAASSSLLFSWKIEAIHSS